MKNLTLFLLLMVAASLTWATIDAYDFPDDEQRARFQGFTQTMRCPKCQNQNLADSDAPIAKDLRGVLHGLVKDGKTDQEIVDFMVNRYGEFVLYEPPLKGSTWMLWFGPLIFLIVGFLVITMFVRKRPDADKAGGNTAEQGADASSTLSEQEQEKLKQLLDEPKG